VSEETKTIPMKYGYELEDYKLDARDCMGCAGCRWVDFIYMPGWDFSWRCPPWLKYRFDDYGACGKLRIIYDLLGGRLNYESPTVAEVAYSCMLCGACDAACKRNLDLEPQAALEAFRVRLVELGRGPLPAHQTISRNIIRHHHRFGVTAVGKLSWLPSNIRTAPAAPILYYAGCRATTGNGLTAAAAASLIHASGTPFMVLENEFCCGQYLVSTGQIREARKIATANLDRIKATGAEKVVFSCAECYKTFKVDYPKLLGISTVELPFQVLHLTESLDEWIKCDKLHFKNSLSMVVTYHDACALGRLSEPWVHWEGKRREWGILEPKRNVRRATHGIYEPPRNVLKSIPGLKLVEMPRHHENAWCCGHGGGVKEAFPDLASWTAGERLREAASVGAEAVIAACPGCRDNLSGVADQSIGKVQVYEFHEFLLKALGR
jgi:Fe-S oxidoreductase